MPALQNGTGQFFQKIANTNLPKIEYNKYDFNSKLHCFLQLNHDE